MIKNKKGVSPIIATVLLISITISVAILLRVWYVSQIQESQNTTSDIIRQKLNQSGEQIRVSGYGEEAGLWYIYIKNTGTSNIEITDNNGNYLITTYIDNIPTQITWERDDGTALGNNEILAPGEMIRTSDASITPLTLGSLYTITTRNGFSLNFRYNIGSVSVSTSPDYAIANGSNLDGTNSNTIDVSVTVTDSFGNPIQNHPVTIVTTSGSFGGGQQTVVNTDVDGIATATLTPSGTPGDVTIFATATGGSVTASGQAQVTYLPALQIVSFVATWNNSDHTEIKVVMVVKNVTSGTLITNVAPYSSTGVQGKLTRNFSGLTIDDPTNTDTQTLDAGETYSWIWIYTVSGNGSVYFSGYVSGNSGVIVSQISNTNTLTR